MDDLVERVARKLCERAIRTARKWDTEPDELERILPGGIDYSFTDYLDEARAIIPIVYEDAARICDGVVEEDCYCLSCRDFAQSIRSRVLALK